MRIKSKEFDVLLVLLKNRSRLVTKAELMEAVWPNSYVAEANLGVHIASLRKVLRKHAPGHRYIETVHKYGYRFVEAVLDDGEDLPVEVEPSVVNHLRESLTAVSPEAVLSLAGGLRIEARKSASGTEVTMTIPKTTESLAERSEIALRHWSLHKDGVTITSTPLGGSSCVRILFKNTE